MQVGAHNFYGTDSARLEAIRTRHMTREPTSFAADAECPGIHYPALAMPEMPGLLAAYKQQYTSQWNGFTTTPVVAKFTRGVVNTGNDRQALAETGNDWQASAEAPEPTRSVKPQLTRLLKRGATVVGADALGITR